MKKILIVGRPNVGKSSLFNRLARQRSALTLNHPGVTRDVLKQKCAWWGGEFEVWDSGGLWAEDLKWSEFINQQVQSAITLTDLVLFVMDARSGLLDEDKKTFRLVQKSGKPFLVLVNKVDDFRKKDLLLSDFQSLGVDLLPCSFEQGEGVPEIVEWVLFHSSNRRVKSHQTLKKQNSKKVAHKSESGKNKPVLVLLAGQVNVGKSALCNSLLKKNRSLVSPIAGATRDIVQESLVWHKQNYSLWDSAGFKGAKKTKIESLSALKTHQSFEEADLILLLLDGEVGPNRLSARILNLCAQEHKPVIVVVNKWDLVEDRQDKGGSRSGFKGVKKFQSVTSKTQVTKRPLNMRTKKEYRKYVQRHFRFYPDLPVVFISALKSKGLGQLMKEVAEIYKKSCFRVSTSELNRFFMQVIRQAPSPVYGTQNVRFYYLTQTKEVPPAFIAFANHPKGVRGAYKRFIIRQIQEKWNLKGVPVRLTVLPRPRNQKAHQK